MADNKSNFITVGNRYQSNTIHVALNSGVAYLSPKEAYSMSLALQDACKRCETPASEPLAGLRATAKAT